MTVAHYEVTVCTSRPVPRLRIAFASDFHVGPTTPHRLLDAAVEQLAALEPDVVLLGGDFVFLDATMHTRRVLTEHLRGLPKVPTFAVLGNHDLWTHHHHVEHALSDAGVVLLENRAARLPPPHDDVVIYGLDDPWTGEPEMNRSEQANGALAIGLCHAPDGVTTFARGGVPLMLCGHTHGGQIALPGGRPIVLPPGPHSRQMPCGRYEVDGVTVIVSKGVGTTELPIRTFAAPEVVCVDVRTGAPTL